MSNPEKLKKKIQKQSWMSNLILACPDTESCVFSNQTKVHQHAFTTRIVPPNDDSRSLLIVIKGVIFRNLEPVPFDPSLDAEPETCFNCQRKGHTYKKCWREKTLYCLNCGRREVQAANCPRCAKAYQQFVKSGRSVRSMPSESTDVPSRDKNRPRSLGRMGRDKSRSRARENFESRIPQERSRRRSKVRWLDLQDSNGSQGEKAEGGGHEGRRTSGRNFVNNEMKSEKLGMESNGGMTREFLDVMAAVKHLPSETQNAVALHFLKQKGTVIHSKKDWSRSRR